MQKINSIIDVFILSLDEAMATLKVLESTRGKDKRPNHLLFSHVINSFDSFIREITKEILNADDLLIRQKFKEFKNLDSKVSFDDLIKIDELGLIGYMKEIVENDFDNRLKNKSHAEVLIELCKFIDIDYKNKIVYLTGPGKHSSGNLRNITDGNYKKALNHKTTSDNLIGYADILYEKRNAIIHNRNKYFEKSIKKLNDKYKLKIENPSVVIKNDSFNSIFRFYSSFGILILNSIKDKNYNLNYDKFLKNLETINGLRNLTDLRYKNEGIDKRRELFISKRKKEFTISDYLKINKGNIKESTARRDFIVFEKEGLIKKSNQRGKYIKI